MTALTDALDRAHWFPFPDNAAGYRGTGGYFQWKDDVAAIVAAARRVADAPEVLYCSNHHQLGNELWCSHGRIWDKGCRMVRRLLVDP